MLIKYNNVQITSDMSVCVISCVGAVGDYRKYFTGKAVVFKQTNKLFIFSKIAYRLLLKSISAMVIGATFGYFVEIEFVGLGYRFLKLRNFLLLKLGFSHYVKYIIPKSVYVIGYKRKLVIYGLDVVNLNNLANHFREFKKPNIYKGKGIQIRGEVLQFKVGKKK